MATQDLGALLRTIGAAIREALQAVDAHSVQSFQDNFDATRDANGEPLVSPKTIVVAVPHSNGTYRTVAVPQVALMHHNALQIEELRLKFRVTMSESENNETVQVELARPAETTAASAQAPGAAEVEILFRRGDPPEGIARIAGGFHKML